MAFGRYPERTILIEFGDVKKFSDVAGRHAVRLTNDASRRLDLANRLKTAGCAVSTLGEDWLKEGDFTITRLPLSIKDAPSHLDPSHPTLTPHKCPACSTADKPVYLTRLSWSDQQLYDATHGCPQCTYREKFP